MLGKLTVGMLSDPLKGAVNIYIGRSSKNGSPLGNPYVINATCTRDQACDQYEEYLMHELNNGNQVIIKEMNRIGSLILQGKNVNLCCFCVKKKLRCHGEIIAQIISNQILEYQASQEK